MGKSLLVTLGIAQEQIVQTYVPDGSRTVEINGGGNYLHNAISTGKYSFVSFVPKFTLEFFSKYANMFFLFISCIQPIGDLSPTSKVATAGPLAGIFIITALKEMWEDRKRHAQDNAVNNSVCKVLRGNKFVETLWKDVKVGEIVRVENGQNFPSDLVIISTSEPDSLCYIETSNLDGETNLKIRQGLPETGNLLSPEAVAKLQGTIETELPNNSLYTFKATLRANGKELAIGPNQLLLRGAQLRNTKWAYGLVVFTGHETKLMKNSTATPIKSTKVDSMVNSQVVLLFVFLILLAVGCAVGELYMEKSTNFVQDILSPVGGFAPTTPFQFFEHVLTFMILFNNLIPLSLMISLEFVKLVLGMYINQDLDMYYDEKDMPATAKTTTLVEELGQIDFIFSDKTGTLTRNIMEFRKISAGGYAYSDSREIDSSKGYYHFSHLEQHLRTKERGRILDEFLSLLSVCHTVIPERDEVNPSKIIYQASSPDEVALVDGAKQLGYTFHTRRPKSVTVNVNGVDREYQIYQVNEFNSTRKRMSLVVRGPDGKVKLMIKGAETVIVERLAKGCTFLENTTQHMEEYASEGLRTLVYAYREIGEAEYQRWRTAYEKAATSITNREEMLDQAAEMIEKDLQLLGATAIEDKLQDGVPETIHNLLEAGIRLWVLTGDRQDTAINIGISCRLLNSQMEMIVCNKETKEETKQFLMKELQNAKKRLNYQYTRPSKWKQFWRGINGKTAKFDKDYGVGVEPMALVIDGNTLTHALDPEISDIFLEVALLCKSVICCRVSPLQKALVVKLVKNNVAGAVTLAIGDGANDVSMIQSANVGVGISGQEGLQAARSADFAIGQFRYLRKLLLVHGGWAYSRISKVILISFYKNLALYLIQCWFTFSNFFSGMTLFETWSAVSSYNVVWTLLPPIAIGIFDQYISAQVLFKYPSMYRNGQDDKFYNHKSFLKWIVNAIIHSLLLFYMWTLILGESDILANGLVSDNWVFGIMVYTTTLVTVMFKHCLIVDLLNFWILFAIFGSLAAFFILFPIYALSFIGPKLISKELFNVDWPLFYSITFWLSLLLLPIGINLRDFAWKFYKRFYIPQRYHIVQEIQHQNIPDYRPKSPWFYNTVSKIKKMKNMRNTYGYAFSQNEQPQSPIVRLYDTTKRKPRVAQIVEKAERGLSNSMGKSLLVTLGLAQEQIVQTYVPDGSRTVDINSKGDFLSNKISTGKYSIISFIPKFTLEFFSKYANMFFLFISCIQPVRDWSPTSKIATAGPLAAIFIITAFKEMWEDKKRHSQDSSVNNSECKVLRGNKFVETLWKDVKVGEIVRVENGQNFPSDLVIISTSEPDSLCYIETSNLDGETNLKIRQGLPETGNLLSPEAVAKLQGTIETELPNNSLYTFKATLRFAGQELAVGPNQLLLRGAQLRNTKWIYGLVVFTGHETKLMKNSTTTPIKSTKVDSMVNSQVILLFVFLVLLAVGCAVGELYMEKSTNFVQDILSPVGGFAPTTPFQFFEHVMTFMILFNNLIPLSLMISLEFVKLVLGMYINQDLDMYYDEKDMPATAKTTTLVEELGQIDFIFSDKTGTLTRNIMEFKKFSVGGNAYTLTEWPTQTEKGYYNKTHFEAHKGNPEFSVLKDFLSLLSVCHTVIPEVEENSDKIIYQASSPDEVALVDGARALGYVFHTRRPKSVTMSADGVNKEYQILHVNEFNSTRKRMSLVVRGPDGKVKLMVKGAETVILERLGSGCPFKEATMQHMEEYANEGLRTLVYAYRDIDEAEYQEWRHIYEKAATSITNREEMLDQAAEMIEKGLHLVGATAIEDKLQEGVPETIYNLLEAGIRMWVLTGDRQDTAINIGISCKLLNPQMEMIVCNKETKEETKTFLVDALNDVKKRLSTKYTRPSKWKQFWRGIHVKDAKFDKDYGVGVEPMALVIDGNTLTHALDPEISDIFLEVALLCKSVICCRVSPLQKALVVKLVKNNVAGAVTLAIGDGANDVSMIQSANVGVGISGQEGLQAARSADFAIGQFRYLRKLLLVHGGWAYSRISKVILISFYKNLALYLIQCWFTFSNFFSGMTLFETWSGVSSYNVAWTLLPPIAIGIFDQYISAQVLFKYPRMYRNGQDDRFYNHYIFILWILNAIFHSLLLFYGWVYILGDSDILANGLVSDNWVFGIFVYVTALTTVMIKHCLIIDLFNGWTLFSIFGSLFAYYILLPIYCLNDLGPKYISKELFNVNTAVFGSVTFFLSLIFLPFAINLRDFAWKFYKRFFAPQSYHIIQEIQKHNIPDYSVQAQWFHTTVSKIQKMKEMNLGYGYAFSQNDQQLENKVVALYDTTKRKPHG